MHTLLGAVVLVLIGGTVARAECVGFPLDHYRRYADVIFRGVVLEVKPLDGDRAIVSFSVSRVWKGNVGARFTLHQVEHGLIERQSWVGTTGIDHLVFAKRLDASQRKAFSVTTIDAFTVPMCGGGTTSTAAAHAQEYLRQLGSGRAPDADSKFPDWLAALIKQVESEPVSNPPSRILEFQYRDQTVYYRPSRCCDIPGELYDAKGARICSPDGGFTGRGDGKCADFFEERKSERIVWSDPRRR